MVSALVLLGEGMLDAEDVRITLAMDTMSLWEFLLLRDPFSSLCNGLWAGRSRLHFYLTSLF
jgi:hypothetical protein